MLTCSLEDLPTQLIKHSKSGPFDPPSTTKCNMLTSGALVTSRELSGALVTSRELSGALVTSRELGVTLLESTNEVMGNSSPLQQRGFQQPPVLSLGQVGRGRHGEVPTDLERVGRGRHGEVPTDLGQVGRGRHGEVPTDLGQVGRGRHGEVPTDLERGCQQNGDGKRRIVVKTESESSEPYAFESVGHLICSTTRHL